MSPTEISAATHKSRTLAIMASVTALVALDTSIVGVILPSVARSLHASFGSVEWVITGYILSFASLLVPAGVFSDRFGRRTGVLVGVAIFGVASLLCGLAGTATRLTAARILQGVGAAFLPSASLAVIGHTFRGPERARAFAFWGAALGIAIATGPLVGGAIASVAGWRWAFLLNVPICALLLLLIWRHVDESRDPDAAGFDVPGILTFSSALFFLTWALIEVNNSAWNSFPVIWRAATATALLTGFMLLEGRQRHPMIDPGLFRFPAFIGAAAAMAGYAAAGQMLIFYLPLYLQNKFALTPLRAGIAMLPFAFPMFLAPRLRGHLPDSSRKVLFFGMIATCLGDLLLAASARQDSYLAFAVGMAIAGSGAGILNGETAKVLQGSVPAERGGMAAGLSATIRFTALLTSVAGLGAVLSGVTSRVFALDTAPLGSALDRQTLVGRIVAGDLSRAISLQPEGLQSQISQAAQSAFSGGFAVAMLCASLFAAAVGIASYLLVQERDISDIRSGKPTGEDIEVISE